MRAGPGAGGRRVAVGAARAGSRCAHPPGTPTRKWKRLRGGRCKVRKRCVLDGDSEPGNEKSSASRKSKTGCSHWKEWRHGAGRAPSRPSDEIIGRFFPGGVDVPRTAACLRPGTRMQAPSCPRAARSVGRWRWVGEVYYWISAFCFDDLFLFFFFPVFGSVCFWRTVQVLQVARPERSTWIHPPAPPGEQVTRRRLIAARYNHSRQRPDR